TEVCAPIWAAANFLKVALFSSWATQLPSGVPSAVELRTLPVAPSIEILTVTFSPPFAWPLHLLSALALALARPALMSSAVSFCGRPLVSAGGLVEPPPPPPPPPFLHFDESRRQSTETSSASFSFVGAGLVSPPSLVAVALVS